MCPDSVGSERDRSEQRGAERVFAALSVHFAGHPDFDAVLAEFDGKGWTKEGAADLVPADDEVTVKREALRKVLAGRPSPEYWPAADECAAALNERKEA